MTPQAVFITHRAKPGHRADAVAVWDRIMRPAVQANPDHLAYVYTVPDAEPDVIRAFQLYRSAATAAAYLQTSEYLEYTRIVEPFLEGPPEVSSCPAHWVKS